MPRTLPRWAIDAGLCLTAAGCKRVPRPAPDATARRPSPPVVRTRPASAPTSIPSQGGSAASAPASQPGAGVPASGPSGEGSVQARRSSLTPLLESVVRTLRARPRGQLFKVRAELAAHLPGFESGEGKEVFAGEASVEVLELRGDYLQVAFVRLTPKGFKPCDDKAPQRETYALFVGRQEDGSERLRFTQDFAADETLIFDSKSMRVVVPPIAAAVPVFEVHYDRVPACLSDDEPSSGKMVEVFHLTSGARVGGPIPVDTSSDVPGHDSRVRSTIQWLRGRAPTTTLLAVTTTKTETTRPCTGDGVDDSSPECQPQVECERKTGIIALTREGEQTEHELATLRRSEPALARLPRDRTGSSQSACGRL